MGSKQTPGMSGSNLTKEQRRDVAIEKARLLQEQEKKRAKRNKLIVVIASVVLFIAVVFVIVQIINSAKQAAEPKNVTEDYGIVLDSNGAATTHIQDVPQVGIYEDTVCVHCWELASGAKDAISAHLEKGDVQFTIYPVSIFPQQQSSLGAASLFYIASEAPESFHEYYDMLMDATYGIYPQMQNGANPTVDDFVEAARAAKVPEDVTKDMGEDIQSAQWKNFVNEATQDFINEFKEEAGTPTVMLNGEKYDDWGTPDQFGDWLDEIASEGK